MKLTQAKVEKGVVIIVLALMLAAIYQIYTKQNLLEDQLAKLGQRISEASGEIAKRESAAEFIDRVERAIESIVDRRRVESASANGTRRAPQMPTVTVSAGDEGPVYGDPNAPISLITFVDYQCGFCARFHPVAKQIVEQSNGLVNWSVINYPVLGPRSQQLAAAGECIAQEQSPALAWSFASNAYSTKNWSISAQRAGADMALLNDCMDEQRYASVISDNLDLGRELGVTGTPATVVRNNATEVGQLVRGALPFENMMAVIQEVARNGSD